MVITSDSRRLLHEDFLGSTGEGDFNTKAPSAFILIPIENISDEKIFLFRYVSVLLVHLYHSRDKKKAESFPDSATGNSPCWERAQLYSSSMKAAFCHLLPLSQCRRQTSVSREPGTWNTLSVSVSLRKATLTCAKAESAVEPDTISECLYACILGLFQFFCFSST